MLRSLFSASLILLFISGGGGLPLLDGLIFHSRARGTEVLRPHLEGTSGCHADGCTVRSTAQQARFAPVLNPVAKIVSAPETSAFVRNLPTPLAEPLRGQALSRAPPRLG